MLIYGLTNGSVVALSACGFTLACAVARQINLAHGNVFALTTIVLAHEALAMGITRETSSALRIVAATGQVVFGALVGTVLSIGVERLAFRPFQARSDRLGSLIATVAISFVLYQVAVWWYALTYVPSGGVVGHFGVSAGDRGIRPTPGQRAQRHLTHLLGQPDRSAFSQSGGLWRCALSIDTGTTTARQDTG